MAKQATCKILMYSHDTYGLGHIRRTMAIATNLLGKDKRVNILIITGSPIVGRFDFPEKVDFVRMPGMIKKSNEIYLPHSIKINPSHALNIRRSIITATAKAFTPDIFIVDKAPLGLKREIMPTLKWMKRQTPRVRTVLGLRDIMDDAESTRQDWKEKGVYDVLEEFYSEIWVYGHRELYDPVAEYDIPGSIASKMVFTGYIPRQVYPAGRLGEAKNGRKADGRKLVVVTTGGGGDGYPLMDAFLKSLEDSGGEPPFRSIMVSGPFMPKEERSDLSRRAKKLGIPFYHFYRRIEKLIAASDLVVGMGGYNTVSEILCHRTPGLIVPREEPRKEQLIRAQVMGARKLADYLPWDQLTPDLLLKKITAMLADPTPYLEAMAGFEFTGLEVMRERIEVLTSHKP